MTLEKLKTFLKKDSLAYVATSDNGQPHVRAMTLIFCNNRFWSATLTSRNKIREIKANDRMEFCVLLETEKGTGSLRATGKAAVIDDLNIKQELASEISFFNAFWKSPDDPEFCLIELKPEMYLVQNPDDRKFYTVMPG